MFDGQEPIVGSMPISSFSYFRWAEVRVSTIEIDPIMICLLPASNGVCKILEEGLQFME